jgi:hypothetical protein
MQTLRRIYDNTSDTLLINLPATFQYRRLEVIILPLDEVQYRANSPATNALQAFIDSKDNLALADLNTEDFSADRKTAKERESEI